MGDAQLRTRCGGCECRSSSVLGCMCVQRESFIMVDNNMELRHAGICNAWPAPRLTQVESSRAELGWTTRDSWQHRDEQYQNYPYQKATRGVAEQSRCLPVEAQKKQAVSISLLMRKTCGETRCIIQNITAVTSLRSAENLILRSSQEQHITHSKRVCVTSKMWNFGAHVLKPCRAMPARHSE